MDLGAAYLITRVFHAGLGVGLTRAQPVLLDMGEIVVLPHGALARAHVHLQGLDIDGIGPELFCQVGAGNDRHRRAVGDAAAVVKPERPGDNRGIDHLVDGELVLEVGLRIEAAVVVVLHGNLRQESFTFFRLDLVVVEVAGGHIGERRRGAVAGPDAGAGVLVVPDDARALDARRAGVLELFHAYRQGNITDTGGHGIAGGAQSLRACSAHVFHAGHGDIL